MAINLNFPSKITSVSRHLSSLFHFTPLSRDLNTNNILFKKAVFVVLLLLSNLEHTDNIVESYVTEGCSA